MVDSKAEAMRSTPGRRSKQGLMPRDCIPSLGGSLHLSGHPPPVGASMALLMPELQLALLLKQLAWLAWRLAGGDLT